MNFLDALQRVMDHHSLSRAEAHQAMKELMRGAASPVQIAAFLAALRVKGETADEIAGAAEAMREEAVAVRTTKQPLVDTCGTGGDGRGTFNVSTAAAFVVAGAGFAVAKHGNRAVSSKCGSADLLEALGMPMESDPKKAEARLERDGLAFLFAPAFHPAMKHAMPVRRELGVRTIFNLLGPLANPARPTVQLMGVYDPRWLAPLANVLGQLGCEEAVVVHGQGFDEIALDGPTQIAELHGGRVELTTWKPEDFGLEPQAPPPSPGGPGPCAEILKDVLDGRPGFYLDQVCMNAAAAIRAATRSKAGGQKTLSLKESLQLARRSIDSRAALKKFERLKNHV
jgi:anthranilate phosphoribosyltransferase